MIDFFIALIGGTYLAGKSLMDKIDAADAKAKEEQRREKNEMIRREIEASDDLVEEIERRIRNGGDNILDELSDDFKFAYGEDYDIYNRLTYLRHGYRGADITEPGSNLYWAYHLLLSHQGKVDFFTYLQGFQLGGIRVVDRDIKFCHRIEQHLNANGVDLKLYMQPRIGVDDKIAHSPCARLMRFEHQIIGTGDRLW